MINFFNEYILETNKKDKDTSPYYQNVDSKRIEIGSSEPVKSFKDWSSKQWRKKGEDKLKYEPNSGVSQKEKVKSLEPMVHTDDRLKRVSKRMKWD